MEKFKLFHETVSSDSNHIGTITANSEWFGAFEGGVIKMYSGGMPANPNDPIDEKFLIGTVEHPGRVE